MNYRKAIQRSIKLKADSTGNPPTHIQFMKAGQWNAPWHGSFEMTSDDLAEMVQHFNDGVGMVEGSNKLPINYGHDITGKAAGWITSLSVENGGTELWGDVEWTPEGEQMLADGSFRYISPEWNPRSFPYQDPEDEENWLDNVFTGAGLTNIPLFKKLKPIMASIVAPKAQQASVVTDDSDNSKGESMALKLEEVRTKEADTLTAEEKTFLEEHKSELTAEEVEKFGLEVADSDDDQADDADDSNDANDNADDDSDSNDGVKGSVAIPSSELAQLRADAKAGREAAQKLATKEATDFIAAAVRDGRIKTGESDKAVKMLLASSGSHRKDLEAFITGLPKNDSLGKELGDTGVEASADVVAEIDTKTRAILASAREAGKTMSYAAARKQVLTDNPALKDQLKEVK